MQDDPTIIAGMSNDEIAEHTKLKSTITGIIRKLPFTSYQNKIISEIADNAAKDQVKSALKRFGQRVGDNEIAVKDLAHKMELKDQLHESDIKSATKAVETLKADVIRWFVALGIIMSLAIAAVAAFK